jgi:hypothetical protein
MDPGWVASASRERAGDDVEHRRDDQAEDGPIMPKKRAVPSAWRISAAAPVAIASGSAPKMKANEDRAHADLGRLDRHFARGSRRRQYLCPGATMEERSRRRPRRAPRCSSRAATGEVLIRPGINLQIGPLAFPIA